MLTYKLVSLIANGNIGSFFGLFQRYMKFVPLTPEKEFFSSFLVEEIVLLWQRGLNIS